MNEGEFVVVQSQGNLFNHPCMKKHLHVRYKVTHSKKKTVYSTLITFLQWIVLVNMTTDYSNIQLILVIYLLQK